MADSQVAQVRRDEMRHMDKKASTTIYLNFTKEPIEAQRMDIEAKRMDVVARRLDVETKIRAEDTKIMLADLATMDDDAGA
jgi:hypothetical protein